MVGAITDSLELCGVVRGTWGVAGQCGKYSRVASGVWAAGFVTDGASSESYTEWIVGSVGWV